VGKEEGGRKVGRKEGRKETFLAVTNTDRHKKGHLCYFLIITCTML
jgi:hypothetical protein